MTRLRNLSVKQINRFIWIFYTIGIVGYGMPWTREFFTYLVPLNILISFIILLITDKSNQKQLLPIALGIFVFGYLIEVIGVNTGLVFGEFSFGKSLGPKLFGVPIFIGWYWLMLAYCSNIIVSRFTENRYFISFLATVLMVVFDMVLEGPAGVLEMWKWTWTNVPMMNFLSWFIISWIINGIIQLRNPKLDNPVAGTLYGANFAFLLCLNIVFFIEQGI
jgi:putative membrane protein